MTTAPRQDVATRTGRALRLGVAGPVRTGKSSLIATVCRHMAGELSLAVITNDIYTDEDARFLRSAGVLDAERIRAVETGACPHTAIRDDITMNLLAVEDLERDFAPVDVVLVESGGDNLTATFSPGRVDAQIFVLDVAGGGDVARKGGPGIARADLLVINKTDLGPHVDVDVDQMVADATAARHGGPVLALSRKDPESVAKRVGAVDAPAARRRDPHPHRPRSHGAALPRLRGERRAVPRPQRLPDRLSHRLSHRLADQLRTGGRGGGGRRHGAGEADLALEGRRRRDRGTSELTPQHRGSGAGAGDVGG